MAPERLFGGFDLVGEYRRSLEVAARGGGHDGRRPDLREQRMLRRAGERHSDPRPVHRGITDHGAVHRQGRDEAQRGIRGRRLDSPVERGAEVVGVARDDVGPVAIWSRAPQVRTGRFGERDVVLGVATPNVGGVAARLEPLLRVLADGLEQPVPRRRRRPSSTTTSDLSTS